MLTRDHAYDHEYINYYLINLYNIIVYLQLDTEPRIIVDVEATLCMTCCNLQHGCLFIHALYYKLGLCIDW